MFTIRGSLDPSAMCTVMVRITQESSMPRVMRLSFLGTLRTPRHRAKRTSTIKESVHVFFDELERTNLIVEDEDFSIGLYRSKDQTTTTLDITNPSVQDKARDLREDVGESFLTSLNLRLLSHEKLYLFIHDQRSRPHLTLILSHLQGQGCSCVLTLLVQLSMILIGGLKLTVLLTHSVLIMRSFLLQNPRTLRKYLLIQISSMQCKKNV